MTYETLGTLESTYQYICLLGDALNEARASVQEDITDAAAGGASRRQDALRLIQLKLDQLQTHITASRPILNDLRTLRRVLLGERHSAQAESTASYSAPTDRPRMACGGW